MTNPVLPGFHPDPSVCRAGDHYYLAASSFEYVPGVPIHRSADLVTWEFVGHALPDAAVVNAPVGDAGASSGIFAPTLRHHDGRFWMVTTSIRDYDRGQLIVHAEDPAGPWSAPVYVEGAAGIDPDLAWGRDGTCLLTWRGNDPAGIHQVAVDPVTGARLGEPTVIWTGTGLADLEAPHLVRRGDWWYLVVAEGGTHKGHSVSVARARDPRGPFESHPANPVFSHRSLAHPVQAAGHADLVERADGSWAAVYLGIRQEGSFPGFHVLGREAFLAGVEWHDDWPVVVDDAFDVPARDHAWEDRFDGPALDPRWVAPGEAPASFCETGEGLALAAGRDADDGEQLRMIAARVLDRGWEAAAHVPEGDACLSVRIDATHWYGIERVGGELRARAVSAPFDQVLARASAREGDVLAVRAVPTPPGIGAHRSGPDTVALGLEREGAFVELASLDGRHLSTELAGGFTGRMLGLEALGGPARVARVTYRPA
ncbi:glycoside hydrolase family 43 protein [Demequina pelophila]|uniref:glycoside hydrolase family 43 protein n=1 Tax=Demequina pelophila TaxID=1638984 RepID=UPI0007826A6F|nr:glycoside hydrolase family 43 protein [Demequina pelophila]